MSEKATRSSRKELFITLLSAGLIPPALIYMMSLPWHDQIFPSFTNSSPSLSSEIADMEINMTVNVSPPSGPAPEAIITPARLFNLDGSIVFCRPLDASVSRPLTSKPIHVIYAPEPLVCQAPN